MSSPVSGSFRGARRCNCCPHPTLILYDLLPKSWAVDTLSLKASSSAFGPGVLLRVPPPRACTPTPATHATERRVASVLSCFPPFLKDPGTMRSDQKLDEARSAAFFFCFKRQGGKSQRGREGGEAKDVCSRPVNQAWFDVCTDGKRGLTEREREDGVHVAGGSRMYKRVVGDVGRGSGVEGAGMLKGGGGTGGGVAGLRGRSTSSLSIRADDARGVLLLALGREARRRRRA